MRWLLNETRARPFTSAIFSHIVLSLVVQYLLIIRSSHGLHLSKTISYTALNLAKEAGMEEEDISAAAMLSGGEDMDEESGKTRQIEQDDIPPISDSVQSFGGPVLPLCCSRETDDLLYYQCGGSSVSKENLNDNGNGIQKSWVAPASVVSTKLSTDFRLEKSVLSCHYAAFSASISLSENSTEGHYFAPDGHLKFENEFYRINEYCISSIKKDKVSLQICQANCSDPLTPCIQKCCGLDEVYSFGSDDYPSGCQPIAKGGGGGGDSTYTSGEISQSVIKWSPHLYHDLSHKLSHYESSQLAPHYIQRYPSNFKNKCKSKKTTVFPFGMGVADYLTMVTGKAFKNLEFRLRKDGWLLYPFRDSKGNEIPVINRILNYCVDGAQAYGELTDYLNAEEQTVLFLCSGGVDEAFENSIIVPESEELATSVNAGGSDNTSGGSSSLEDDNVSLMLSEKNATINSSSPSSIEIYAKNRQKPHVLYQLFQLNSHSRPANIVLNHNAKKLTKVKKRKPSIISLFPNHPNRTKIVTRKMIKKPKYELPVCCSFPSEVNDGQTYHCRNRMVDFSAHQEKLFRNSNITVKPIWNVPDYFMTTGQDTLFALETNSISCGFGKWQLQGFIHNFQLNASSIATSQNAETPVESGITANGYLKYENEFYRPDEFCVNGLSPRIVEVLFCKSNCQSKNTPCVPKCCGMDESYSLGLESGYRGCSPLSEEDPKFHPMFYRNMHHPLKMDSQNKIMPHFIQRYPPTFQHLCYRGITLAFPFSEYVATQLNPKDPTTDKGPTFKNLRFRFRSDGKLMYTVPSEDGSSATAIYDRKEFCVDLVTDYGSKQPLMNNENHTILFICASQPNTQDENYR